jgi:hypothetical protein
MFATSKLPARGRHNSTHPQIHHKLPVVIGDVPDRGCKRGEPVRSPVLTRIGMHQVLIVCICDRLVDQLERIILGPKMRKTLTMLKFAIRESRFQPVLESPIRTREPRILLALNPLLGGHRSHRYRISLINVFTESAQDLSHAPGLSEAPTGTVRDITIKDL